MALNTQTKAGILEFIDQALERQRVWVNGGIVHWDVTVALLDPETGALPSVWDVTRSFEVAADPDSGHLIENVDCDVSTLFSRRGQSLPEVKLPFIVLLYGLAARDVGVDNPAVKALHRYLSGELKK